jgi:hypothetical protein
MTDPSVLSDSDLVTHWRTYQGRIDFCNRRLNDTTGRLDVRTVPYLREVIRTHSAAILLISRELWKRQRTS